MSLSPTDTAIARHRAYALLSRIFLDGPTADLQPALQAVPALAAVLPETSADETSAAHQALFGFNVFPYESIFLDDTGLLGGDVTDAVTRAYQAAGHAVQDDATSPDHVGHELGFLAFLCAAEADAWADDLPGMAERVRRLQQQFLAEHLLPWLPPLALAIAQQRSPFYAAAARLAADLAADHAAALSQIPPAAPAHPLIRANPLENEKTGLRDIAAYLTTPAFCGLYLSRDDVARLARAHDLPRGFGSRQLMLHNLLRSAVQFDALPRLLAALQALTADWLAEYGRFPTANPLWQPFIAPWHERAAATQAMLAQLAAQAQALDD